MLKGKRRELVQSALKKIKIGLIVNLNWKSGGASLMAKKKQDGIIIGVKMSPNERERIKELEDKVFQRDNSIKVLKKNNADLFKANEKLEAELKQVKKNAKQLEIWLDIERQNKKKLPSKERVLLAEILGKKLNKLTKKEQIETLKNGKLHRTSTIC